MISWNLETIVIGSLLWSAYCNLDIAKGAWPTPISHAHRAPRPTSLIDGTDMQVAS
jgi:hypothetical protein